MSERPRYRIPIRRLLQTAVYMARNHPRNLGSDFEHLIPTLPATPAVFGSENLPRSGAFVLVANHYERPGLWMGWSGMVTARAVFEHTRRRLHWIAIAEWRDHRVAGIGVPPGVTRFIFERFFNTFGFIPMEPEGSSAHDRAEGVRAAISAVKIGEPVGIFPEGNIGSTPAMIVAQPGSGLFLLALSARGAKIIPVGLYESGDRMQVRFGEPIQLPDSKGEGRIARDKAASGHAMRSVARLLPIELHGDYASTEG